MPDNSKSDDPDEKKYTGPPGWGLGVWLTTSSQINIMLRKLQRCLGEE
jgi:hypothetical protein